MTRGFTLVELLIGVVLTGLIMSTGVVLLFTSLRTAKKASAVGIAKSEGAYALNAMSQKIRYAKDIASCTGTSLTVDLVDGTNVNYLLAGTALTSGGVNLTSARVVVAACSGAVFTCDVNSVTVCFNVSLAGVTDVKETGSAGFKSEINLRNYGY